MKTTRLVTTLLAAAIVASPAVNAAENDSVLLVNQGKLVLPHLVVEDKIYYAELDRIGNSYAFDVNEASVIEITPQEGDDWATAEELVGDWAPEGMADHTLTFDADGTYSVTVPAATGCPAGTETGTWTIDSTTGVFTARAIVDTNGTCGLSHPSGMIRVERAGANLLATVYVVNGNEQVKTGVTFEPIAQ